MGLSCHCQIDFSFSTSTFFFYFSKFWGTLQIVKNGGIYLECCKSKDQLADISKYPMENDVFEFHKKKLGVVNANTFRGSN